MPWGPHVGTANFGVEAKNRLNEAQLAWFDRWLKGAAPQEPDAPVQLFVMGRDSWRTADAWPPRDREDQDWFLHSDGRANSLSGTGRLTREAPGEELPDVFAYAPGNPAPSAGGRSCCDATVTPMGVACQQGVEVRNDVLVYTTDPLEGPLEVTGDVRFVLHAATSAVDTDWVVRLTDVDESGTSVNVCQGILRARFRDGLADPREVTPGECYEYTVPLGPTSWEFGAGHRLRVQVTSSDFPAHDVNSNTGRPTGEVGPLDGVVATQVVHHDASRPSRVILPVATT